jgi:hypothetical protein
MPECPVACSGDEWHPFNYTIDYFLVVPEKGINIIKYN